MLVSMIAAVRLIEWRGGASPVRSDVFGAWLLAVGLWSVGVVLHAYASRLWEPSAGGYIGDWSFALQFVLCLVLHDLLQYLIHRLFHGVPWLWRFHRIHHADAGFDVATSLRFHPVETLLRGLPAGWVMLGLGASPEALALMFPLTAFWNTLEHANLPPSRRFSRGLGAWLVTPGVHRIHHELDAERCNRNFGLVLSLWDRLFGTYLAPDARLRPVGVSGWRHGDDLLANLAAPFRD